MVRNRTSGRKVTRGKVRKQTRELDMATSPRQAVTPQNIEVTAQASASTEGSVAALYEVQPTDTPARIAERFGVSLELFTTVNPEVARLNRVFTGQIVQIPLTPPLLPVITRVATEYVVQEGDTLFSIAQQFRINLLALQKVNPLVTSDRLFAGQLLLIPTVVDWAPAMPALLYVVQPGDTPAMLAGLFGFSITALTEANPQRIHPNRLYAGEFIVLPVNGTPAQPVFDRVRYIVQPMDSIEEIVQQFEVWPFGLGQLNAIVAPIPGLLLQLPVSIPIPAPPDAPEGFPAPRPAPFGRRLVIDDDDAVYVPFPADFRFLFYGQQRIDGVWVNSNGNVTFIEPDLTYVPTTDAFIEGSPRIAVFWTDLAPIAAAGTGGVYVDFFFSIDLGRTCMAITWDRVPIFGFASFNTFQILLSEDGHIVMSYFEVAALPVEQAPRVLIGVAPGQQPPRQGSNIFAYNGVENERRAGDQTEAVPAGSISGRILVYRYDSQERAYKLSFT